MPDALRLIADHVSFALGLYLVSQGGGTEFMQGYGLSHDLGTDWGYDWRGGQGTDWVVYLGLT